MMNVHIVHVYPTVIPHTLHHSSLFLQERSRGHLFQICTRWLNNLPWWVFHSLNCILLLPLTLQGIIEALTCWAVHYCLPSVVVVCQTLRLRQWFHGVFIMRSVLGVLTWWSPSLSRNWILFIKSLTTRFSNISFMHNELLQINLKILLSTSFLLS